MQSIRVLVKQCAKYVLEKFRPLVLKIALFYGFQVSRPRPWVHGQNRLVIESNNLHGIPKSVYFNTRSGNIYVGKGTGFGENVMLLTGKHINIEESKKMNLPFHSVPKTGRDIIIGNNCYVGSGSIIIGPVKIGCYSVIGAGSVVTKDINDYCFVAGNPAKAIRSLSV